MSKRKRGIMPLPEIAPPPHVGTLPPNQRNSAMRAVSFLWQRSKYTRCCLVTGLVLVLCFALMCLWAFGVAIGVLPNVSQTQTAEAQATQTRISGITETAIVLALTPSDTPTPTHTPTETLTPTITYTPTDTLTPTATYTPSKTFTPTQTFTPSATPTASNTPTITPTPTNTLTPTHTPSPTPRLPIRVIIVPQANVRACPDMECDVLDHIAEGDTFVVLDQDTDSDGDTWYALEVAGETAWVFGDLTKEDIPTTEIPYLFADGTLPPSTRAPTATSSTASGDVTVTANSSVNLRSGPGTNYPLAGSLSAGQSVRAVARNGEWVVLSTGAWVATWVVNVEGNYLSLPTRSAPPPPVAQPPAAQPGQPAQATAPPAAPGYTCDCSKTCPHMSSCAEAYFQLNECGCGQRDGDNDGVPCENICPGG